MTINIRFFYQFSFLFVVAVHGLPACVRFFFLHFCCQRFCFCLAHVMADNIPVVICFVILLISNYLKIYNSDMSHMNSNVHKYESNNGNFRNTSSFQSVLSVLHFLFQVFLYSFSFISSGITISFQAITLSSCISSSLG